jgi:hypothetical protein
MAGRRRGLFRRLAGALALAGLGVGCAGPLVYANGRFVHREQGFSFAAPAGQPAWKRVDPDHALLAFLRPGGARMSVQAQCGREPKQSPQLLARGLLIGVAPLHMRQSGPVAVGPWPGWSQVVDLDVDGRERHLKTVTLVARACIVDFLLVAGDDFEAAQTSFDAWWRSFEAGAPQPGGAGS